MHLLLQLMMAKGKSWVLGTGFSLLLLVINSDLLLFLFSFRSYPEIIGFLILFVFPPFISICFLKCVCMALLQVL